MIKVLTAFNDAHAMYLDSCRNSIPEGFLHITQYDHKKGKAWAMNKMLSEVEDEDVIIMLDADDFMTGSPSRSLMAIKKHDLVYRDVVNFNQQRKQEYIKSQDFNVEDFKKRNFIPYSGTMLRGWLAKSEPYPDTFHANDWRYWASLYNHSQDFVYIRGSYVRRRNWTSYKRCNIPVYRKLRRLYYDKKAKNEVNHIIKV